MNVARDVHLRRVRGLDGPPRGADLTAARVYVSDQAHFSIKRSLDTLGFSRDTLVVVPSDEHLRLQAAPVAAAMVGVFSSGRRSPAESASSGAGRL